MEKAKTGNTGAGIRTGALAPIVLAEDDADDRLLTLRALERARLTNEAHCVEDGEELMQFLYQQGRYADAPRPGLILLDLNMPRKNGLEALREIKEHQALKRIPVIVLTTSKAAEDIMLCYELGGNAFVRKPVTFDGLVSAVRAMGHFWFDLARLPD